MPKKAHNQGRTGRLLLAQKIRHEHHTDGFFGLVIQGKQRIGKSSYSQQALAESHGKWELQYAKSLKREVPVCVESNYEAVKDWVVFKPQEFLDLVLVVEEKEQAIVWDDAGYWLFALDWYEDFVKSVSKFMQLAGTIFAGIILTTPNMALISSKVMASLPNYYTCTVTKHGKDTFFNRPRLAKVYESWNYPDGKKGGVWTRWKDNFNAMLPDDYFQWYKPVRDEYLLMAKKLLSKEVRSLKKKDTKSEEAEYMETVHTATGGSEKLKEVNEVLANIESSLQG
jgi:hypothetical protein